MWGFLWTTRGSVPLSGAVSDQAVLNAIEAMLDRQDRLVVKGLGVVTFNRRLGLALFSDWHALYIYERGRFVIEGAAEEREGRRLRYELRSVSLFLLCLLVLAASVILGGMMGDIAGTLRSAAMPLLLAFGGQWLSAVRARAIVRDAVNRAERGA